MSERALADAQEFGVDLRRAGADHTDARKLALTVLRSIRHLKKVRSLPNNKRSAAIARQPLIAIGKRTGHLYGAQTFMRTPDQALAFEGRWQTLRFRCVVIGDDTDTDLRENRMAAQINVPHTHVDLLENPGTAVLTTIGADGLPQSTAVWYLVDDDGVLKTSVVNERQKYKNLVRNPRATLFLMDPANPFRTLEIRATVELEPDPQKVLLHKAAARYNTPVEAIDSPDSVRYVINFDPQHVVAFG